MTEIEQNQLAEPYGTKVPVSGPLPSSEARPLLWRSLLAATLIALAVFLLRAVYLDRSFDIFIDEITYLCTWGWIDTDEVVATIRERPQSVNVIISGRDAPQAIVDLADTVTEMGEVKHAYQQGVRAKRGIDY